jgi:hypothetical protein
MMWAVPTLLHPIDGAILDRFGHMLGLEDFIAGQIGDRAGDFEDTIAGPYR